MAAMFVMRIVGEVSPRSRGGSCKLEINFQGRTGARGGGLDAAESLRGLMMRL